MESIFVHVIFISIRGQKSINQSYFDMYITELDQFTCNILLIFAGKILRMTMFFFRRLRTEHKIKMFLFNSASKKYLRKNTLIKKCNTSPMITVWKYLWAPWNAPMITMTTMASMLRMTMWTPFKINKWVVAIVGGSLSVIFYCILWICLLILETHSACDQFIPTLLNILSVEHH